MDSRAYVFIYPLRTNADIPDDFPQEVRTRNFETGVFLPQDDSNWFTRPPKYPARLLLLEDRCLLIIPHPTSAQSSGEIGLDELLQLESGTSLLLGWLRFTTADGVQEIIYNTRASRPLEKFLNRLKRAWCSARSPAQSIDNEAYGDELDIKFRNSLHFELDVREIAVVQYFEAPVSFKKRFLFFHRVDWRPGNLVLLTSMNRLLWITDEYRGGRELYASVSFSAPASSFRSATIEEIDCRQYLTISFSHGNCWRLPVGHRAEEISSFLHSLNELAAHSLASSENNEIL
jgi:hypothetical protein